jgi:hypothetical protein
VPTSPSLSIWSGGEVEIIIRNEVDDMALMHGICYVSSGERVSKFKDRILPRRSASVKVKTSHLLAGSIKCCLVYELIDQRNERMPIVGFNQVFIAVKVSARPRFNKYKASAAMFMAERGQFIGSKDEMRRLKKDILRDRLVNNTYSFNCDIKGQTLRLEAVFHPGKKSILEAILKEIAGRVDTEPVPFK